MTEQKRPILIIKGKRGSKVSTLESAVKPILKPNNKTSITSKANKKMKAEKTPKPAKVKQEPPKQPRVRTPEQRAKNSAKARAKRKAKREAAFNVLLALFPEIFNIELPKPLKIGIDRDLLKLAAKRKLDITKNQISGGLYFYIDTLAYQKALFEGGSRFDLNGQPCGEVNDKQREAAKKKLDEFQASN